MSTTELSDAIQRRFSSFRRLEPDVYRCELNYGDRPRSVYFVKAVSSLPSDEELALITERFISPSYFSAQNASRWNHYLVLVTDEINREPKFSERKRAIENDKNYARKFVLRASDLDSFLKRDIYQSDEAAVSSTIVDVWTSALNSTGLSEVATQIPRAKVIRNIRAGFVENIESKSTHESDAPKVLGVVRLQVRRFGIRRLVGDFDFARVNLIRGPNGTGKTSLLEAIEHFLCGATNRSKGTAEELDASAQLKGSESLTPYRQLSNQEYQARDRAWYGRLTNKGNMLWEGFARYNFLDTDAAVNFANDSDLRNIKDALSKVALGSSASYLWNRIAEFVTDIDRELAPLRKSINKLEQTLETTRARLAALRSLSPQTEVALDAVRKELTALHWPFPELASTYPDADWFRSFEPLRNFLSSHKEADSPQRVDDVESAMARVLEDFGRASKLQTDTESAAAEHTQLTERLTQADQALRNLKRLEEYLSAGFSNAYASLTECELECARIAPRLVAEGELAQLEKAFVVYPTGQNAAQFEATLRAELSSARERLQALERHRAASLRQADAVKQLVLQLQGLGMQYAKSAADAQSCPLCGTSMDMHELRERINQLAPPDHASAQMEAVAITELANRERAENLTSALNTLHRLTLQIGDKATATVVQLLAQSRTDRSHFEQL